MHVLAETSVPVLWLDVGSAVVLIGAVSWSAAAFPVLLELEMLVNRTKAINSVASNDNKQHSRLVGKNCGKSHIINGQKTVERL